MNGTITIKFTTDDTEGLAALNLIAALHNIAPYMVDNVEIGYTTED